MSTRVEEQSLASTSTKVQDSFHIGAAAAGVSLVQLSHTSPLSAQTFNLILTGLQIGPALSLCLLVHSAWPQ